MKKRLMYVGIIIVLLAVISGLVFAEGHGIGPQLSLDNYDSNMLIIIALIGLAFTMVCAIFLEQNVAKIASKTGSDIGTALLAMASSLPLLVIAVTLALEGRPDLVLINIIGASIANLSLVLGVLALIKPLRRGHSFGRGVLAFFVLAISMSVLYIAFEGFMPYVMMDYTINLFDGYVLLVMFVVFVFSLRFFELHEGGHLESKNSAMESVLAIIFGLAVVWFASTTVRALILIAEHFALPAIIIGSVIGVIGASLPEFAIGVV
ncbi:hypothetical protein ACFLZN_01510, partial [Nanoarchaeota archaeon]